jgi:putative membrane protein
VIRGYSDHAANERTFLAWVRTGIAVIVFGFVIEKFNLFVMALANGGFHDAGRQLSVERISGPFGRNGGLAIIVVGFVLIAIAAVRFVRTMRLLDDEATHAASSIRAELILSAVLAVIVAAVSGYFLIG